MFGVMRAEEGSSAEALVAVARECSPRVEINGPREVTLDLSGLTRLFGDAQAMGEAIGRTATDRGVRVRIAMAGTRTAARLLAHASSTSLTIVAPGQEARALARLPIGLLAVVAHDEPAPSPPRPVALSQDADLTTFRRWGVRTLGEVAALPADAVAARLGQQGVRWQRRARGEDPRPLLPEVPEERFEQTMDLEWPIEGLEPLSFVLSRLMEPLSAHLERRGRGAAVLHVRLHLVTKVVHERTLQLPTPMRDARTLRTLALLDLESHPPAAGIDRVCVAVDPTPARDLQYSLIERPLPPPEQISTLLARLTALMGEGRCGSPVVVDSWEPGAFAMKRFDPGSGIQDSEFDVRSRIPGPQPRIPSPESPAQGPEHPAVALRRFRHPVPARVRVEHGRPVSVDGAVSQCAGPWRAAGHWWTDAAWDRDEWDVTLRDGSAYRVFRDRRTDAWFLDGVLD
jgi:protein ImuB